MSWRLKNEMTKIKMNNKWMMCVGLLESLIQLGKYEVHPSRHSWQTETEPAAGLLVVMRCRNRVKRWLQPSECIMWWLGQEDVRLNEDQPSRLKQRRRSGKVLFHVSWFPGWIFILTGINIQKSTVNNMFAFLKMYRAEKWLYLNEWGLNKISIVFISFIRKCE